MSFDQLRYFVSVADTGSTRAAARACHISQPPLSRHIRALEDELGVPLFQRTARGMALLPAGDRLLEHARTILDAVDGAIAAVHPYRQSDAPSDALEPVGCSGAPT